MDQHPQNTAAANEQPPTAAPPKKITTQTQDTPLLVENGTTQVVVESSNSKLLDAPSGNVSWFEFAWVVLAAIFLTLLARKLGDYFSTRAFRRWLPFTYAAIWSLSTLLLAYLYVENLPQAAWLGLLVIVAGILVAAFLDEIRAMTAGITMSFDHNIKLGDAIRIGNIEGKVIAFRMRFVRIEAPDGVVHDIPNSQFQKHIISNFSEHGEHSRCTIRLPLSKTINPEEAIEAARMACILSPYASIYLKPAILLSEKPDDSQSLLLNINAFAFDQNVKNIYRSDILTRLERTLFKTESPHNQKPKLLYSEVLEP